MSNLLKTTNYHKLCAYNPTTDSTLWLKNYRIRGGEVTLWFTSDPRECALLVVDLTDLVRNFVGNEYELISWSLETCRECGWLN